MTDAASLVLGTPFAAALSVLSAVAAGGDVCEKPEATIVAASGSSQSVALDGDRLAVGDPDDEVVWPFRFDGEGWREEHPLHASGDGGEFGADCALEGDVLAVGAPDDEDRGAVYVFRRAGDRWVEEARLIASPPSENAFFGGSVAVSGDRIVVGARTYGPLDTGAAFVFRFIGQAWEQEAVLRASDGYPNDFFAWSVTIDGPRVLVGAPLDDAPEKDAGSAHLFRLAAGAWIEEAAFVASDGGTRQNFGFDVALRGNLALIGARRFAPDGAAYVLRFDGNGWAEEAKLIGPAGARLASVALGRNRALIGGGGDVPVFRFTGSGWAEVMSLVPSDGGLTGATSASGLRAAAGGLFQAFVFDLGVCPQCAADLDGDGRVGQTDVVTLLVAWGPCPGEDCPADLDANDVVDLRDLVLLLSTWGPCP